MGKAIYKTLGGSSKHFAWPMPIIKNGRILRFATYPFWAKKFLDVVERLEDSGKTSKEIANIFKYPSFLTRLPFVFEIKDLSKLSIDEQKKIAIKIYDYCDFLQQEIFSNNGKNILKNKHYNFDDVLCKNMKESKKILSKLDGLLFSYTELIYGYFHDFGHEFQGPFIIDKTKNAIVKEYHDLKPPFFGLSKKFPADKIVIIEIYTSDISVSIDMHNRLNMPEPIISKLLAYKVIANKKVLSLDEVKRLLSKVQYFYDEFINSIKLEEDFLSIKYIEATFYSLKRACDIVGTHWRPPHFLIEGGYKTTTKKISQWINFLSTMPLTEKNQEMRFNPLISRKEMKKIMRKLQ